MYKGKYVVPVIPAGRKRTLKSLFKHLRLHADIIDYVQVWENTKVKEDVEFIRSEADEFLVPVSLPSKYKFIENPIQHNTGRFYNYTTDKNTIYIRFDDDIVYVHPDFFKNIVSYILDHPEYFLVFANIWNNAVISYIQQQKGNIGKKHGIVKEPYCMDKVGWASPEFAEYIHNILLNHIKKDTVKKLFFNKYELKDQARFSISCFAFRGKDFAKFKGDLSSKPYSETWGGLDEEIWLAECYPREQNLLNVIYGKALVSHLTFFTQKKHILENTDIAQRYERVVKKMYSANYYKLLAESQKKKKKKYPPQYKKLINKFKNRKKSGLKGLKGCSLDEEIARSERVAETVREDFSEKEKEIKKGKERKKIGEERRREEIEERKEAGITYTNPITKEIEVINPITREIEVIKE